MNYRIRSIELYVRDTPPNRMAFSLGKKILSADAKKKATSPLGHVRLILTDTRGNETYGTSADRLSVRWLDKRPGRDHDRKRRELVHLIHAAREIMLDAPRFDSPFALWRMQHPRIMQLGKAQGQEELTSAFVSALMERAVLDAVCRIEDQPLFSMIKQDRIGFRPGEIFPELQGIPLSEVLPDKPRTEFFIRHTVGGSDPLVADDLRPDERVNDGLPETLEEYIRQDGIRYFKIKVSGDPESDLRRLERIWEVIQRAETPVVTLDANESYDNLKLLEQLISGLEEKLLGLFQHILYIEQPLPRGLTLDPSTASDIQRISARKPLIIDEADGRVDAFRKALQIGYQGTSHKNCKGFYKSLINKVLIWHQARQGRFGVLSAEDLQNLPVVPLHQDFTALGVLDLEHCERNGHHYNFGLCMLSEKDRAAVVRHHPDMYQQRGEEWFLDIRQGKVRCASLQCSGFGISTEPDWDSMTPMRAWVLKNHGKQ